MSDNELHYVELFRSDAAARADAIDTARSFIVRAPAGSGKTELLTQRVLALLATAEAPEEIVAVTFTRKAAAEMKDRLLLALARADSSEASSAAGQPHQMLTIQLAQRVLARDRELGWELAANPARLRVQTIDALVQWLAHQLPITMRFGAVARVIEHAEPLYAAAARSTLALIDSSEQRGSETVRHIARLLTHLDNDWPRLQRLLAGMLAKRDQWLRHVGHLDRAALEAPLQRACSEQIDRICGSLPAGHAGELVTLARYAAENLDADSRLSPCADLDGLPEASHQRLDAWRGLAAMLLTNEGSWRTKFDKRDGFPAMKDAKPFKERIAALVDTLRSNDELLRALHGLRELPAPRYDADQWEVIESIVALLPRAAAELMLAFGEAGETDFVQVTRAAVDALGDEDAASDVAHALDSRIRHLLIDEFQDTSITQFELVKRLTVEWRPGDGRTIFVVGDPMQSIYRFREAEVGLFLRAWENGIGAMRLHQLTLARNFRSQRGLVDWVNAAFERVLPAASDIASGAVAFESSAAEHRMPDDAKAVAFYPLIDGSQGEEARRVIEIVQRTFACDPATSIALLVRSRNHLAHITPALRAAGLRFTAVELDPLLTRPLIGDLLALTRALEHLADRVAWLAVLRAPWCGLTLADLSALAEGAADATIWQLVSDPLRREQLSLEGRERLARVAPVFARALDLRGRGLIAERVRQTWWLLGGPACVSTTTDHSDADAFFAHLARREDDARGVIDMAAFEASLARLFAAADSQANGQADSGLQVMTIHRAKGLEFDHVIVPGLGRIPASDQAQLMTWLERPTELGSGELLLSPIYPAGTGKSEDSIYRWIANLHEERQSHENERLLYVAATRARKRLHWLATLPTKDGALCLPRKHSLLARLWPAVELECHRALEERPLRAPATDSVDAGAAAYDQSLRRLPSDWTLPRAPASIKWATSDTPPAAEPAIEFSWASETARRVGIVVHRWLQRIADDALQGWNADRVQAIAPHIERELAGGGVTGDALKAARKRVEQALVSALADARARWVLGAQNNAQSELRLTVHTGADVKRIAIDRTFVDDQGMRWVIDYKTGIHEGADEEEFLDREQQRYRQQLENYAAAFEGSSRLGLYFPLVPGWREWSREEEN